MQKSQQTNKYNGAVSLLTVIISGTIILMLTLTTLYISIDYGKYNSGFINRIDTELLLKSCQEEALYKIRTSRLYSGTFTVVNDGSQCAATVVSESSQYSLVTITATSNNYTQSQSVRVNKNVAPNTVQYLD